MEKALNTLALRMLARSKTLLYAFATLQPNRVAERNG